jgi:hypothetical protein
LRGSFFLSCKDTTNMKIILFYPVARSRKLGTGVSFGHRSNCFHTSCRWRW